MRLTDARQLNWTAAHLAATRIARHCQDAGFVAPEDIHAHHRYVRLVCEEMNALVEALCITPPKDIDVGPGQTGIRTSKITQPTRIERMRVAGPGAVGIDMDDEDNTP